jgi:cell wall-associated NlpC family hydrolase
VREREAAFVATSSTTRATGRRRLVRALAPFAAAAVLITGVTALSGTATAAPTRTIEQVQAELDELERQAADAAEAWNDAKVRQAEIERSIAALKVRIAAAEKAYGGVSRAVDAMARAAYASGGMEPSLQALLADDPDEFLEQSAAIDQVARAQGASLRRTQAARVRLAQLQASLAQKQAAAEAASSEAAAHKATVDEKIGAAERLLASLQAEERQRLEAAAAARRAASAAAARQAADQVSRDTSRAPQTSSPDPNDASTSPERTQGDTDTNPTPSPGNGGATSDRARIAVAYALSKVGNSYVAGGAGPSVFDCSGLTMAAWRQAGVSLPHYSKAQYGSTRRVSRGELRPGDLLFYFGSGAHHVSMYLGGGMMVHAANPSDDVEVTAAWGPWYGERYSGAGRPG